MSRRSLIMRAGRTSESAFPFRGYFLSVGGALLCLLWMAGALLPAPAPGHLTETDSALPPIRIQSAMKAPERVVIDTNQPLPAPSDKAIVVAHSGAAGN